MNIAEKKRFLGNFISLATLQGLNYILPLLTLPYLVRVLGAEKFGLIAFATAVVGYFIVLTDYGFNFSATREVANHKDDKNKLVEIFSSVMTIKILLLLVSFIILLFLILCFEKIGNDAQLYILTFGTVVGQVLFPVWFFQGVERMKYITIINIISKTIFTVAIFLLVKHTSDYLLVPLLTSIGIIIASLISLYIVFFSFNVKFKFQKVATIKMYLKGGSHLFYTSALSNLLTSSGVIVLSLVTNNTVVGYFSAIEKLFRAVVGLFSPLTQALYPISCNKVQDPIAGKIYIRKLLYFIGSAALVVAIGFAIFSEYVVNFMYGSDFSAYSYILAIMMIWLFFGVINNIIGIQYLSASKNDKYYMYSFFIAGIITVLLNIVLVPYFLINGILFSMIFGEILLTIFMIYFISRFKI
ncbi:polysaccharide biosynthesis protein [Acinetobacter sp. TGL-Y2]|uniref:flippase n=1 Tax=Acinetobacter sp. TGL-Y2 TaxID=1407071 RepID=UPI0007A65966|nr:flippase [Acinetobacter sp. TGL-Y2]AMW77516.1 polysaccharide biosynthesis protein [Acinetobacter sp. TGL-Y2]